MVNCCIASGLNFFLFCCCYQFETLSLSGKHTSFLKIAREGVVALLKSLGNITTIAVSSSVAWVVSTTQINAIDSTSPTIRG